MCRTRSVAIGGSVWRASRRGAAMLMVMLVVGIALVVGVTAVVGVRTSTGVVLVEGDHLQARQVAETALGLAISDVQRDPAWRANRAEGVWLNEAGLLGGTATVTAAFAPPALGPDPVRDASFESTFATLPTPLLAPPMSGTLGEWTVSRTAPIQTGTTVPVIGMGPSVGATDGSRSAYIMFGLSVTGTGVLRQEIGSELRPNSVYELTADITTPYAITNRNVEMRVYAGGELVASTERSFIFDPLDPFDPVPPPETADDVPETVGLLVRTALLGTTSAYTLRFMTGGEPPEGPIAIELFARSTGVLDVVWYDNVRFTARRNDPLVLSAVGRYGDASHAATAWVVESLLGGATVMKWSEP